jgi:hypothetical protein
VFEEKWYIFHSNTRPNGANKHTFLLVSGLRMLRIITIKKGGSCLFQFIGLLCMRISICFSLKCFFQYYSSDVFTTLFLILFCKSKSYLSLWINNYIGKKLIVFNTPKELTIKCDTFHVCVVCCGDKSWFAKERDSCLHLKKTSTAIDCEYVDIVDAMTKPNSDRKLFICRLCIMVLHKQHFGLDL